MVTTTNLTALEAALSSALTRVAYNGRQVDYATVDQLLKAINYVKGELATQVGIPRSRQLRMSTSKGLTSADMFYGFDAS